MVFFTCNHCGDSLKKPAVEKHYNTKCRGNIINVSCMDCQKDFHGKEHVAHTKCITEAEKYSAKGFVAKPTKNTNAKKQDSWINVVRSILQTKEYNLNPRTREVFERLENHENVPRKKAKFENFATKCLRVNKRLVDDVWLVLEKELKKMEEARKQENEAKKAEAANKTQNGGEKSNGVKSEQDHEESVESVKKKKKKKNQQQVEETSNGVKREHENEEEVEPVKKKKKKNQEETVANGAADERESPKKKSKKVTEEMVTDVNESVAESTDADNFKWSELLEKLTRKSGENGIALDKLKNKLLKKYKAKLGIEEFDEKQDKKFEKKFTKNIKRCISIKLENDVVKIV